MTKRAGSEVLQSRLSARGRRCWVSTRAPPACGPTSQVQIRLIGGRHGQDTETAMHVPDTWSGKYWGCVSCAGPALDPQCKSTPRLAFRANGIPIMNGAVIGVGLVALVILASAIGVASGQQSRNQAWRRIAAERRLNWENRQRLERLVRSCRRPDCPLRELFDPPPEDGGTRSH